MEGLLEKVLNNSDYDYISDLRGRINDKSVRRALKALAFGEYNLEECTDAISYLTEGKELHSKEEIEKFIQGL